MEAGGRGEMHLSARRGRTRPRRRPVAGRAAGRISGRGQRPFPISYITWRPCAPGRAARTVAGIRTRKTARRKARRQAGWMTGAGRGLGFSPGRPRRSAPPNRRPRSPGARSGGRTQPAAGTPLAGNMAWLCRIGLVMPLQGPEGPRPRVTLCGRGRRRRRAGIRRVQARRATFRCFSPSPGGRTGDERLRRRPGVVATCGARDQGGDAGPLGENVVEPARLRRPPGAAGNRTGPSWEMRRLQEPATLPASHPGAPAECGPARLRRDGAGEIVPLGADTRRERALAAVPPPAALYPAGFHGNCANARRRGRNGGPTARCRRGGSAVHAATDAVLHPVTSPGHLTRSHLTWSP